MAPRSTGFCVRWVMGLESKDAVAKSFQRALKLTGSLLRAVWKTIAIVDANAMATQLIPCQLAPKNSTNQRNRVDPPYSSLSEDIHSQRKCVSQRVN